MRHDESVNFQVFVESVVRKISKRPAHEFTQKMIRVAMMKCHQRKIQIVLILLMVKIS